MLLLLVSWIQIKNKPSLSSSYENPSPVADGCNNIGKDEVHKYLAVVHSPMSIRKTSMLV
jgi:hypothetical protein